MIVVIVIILILAAVLIPNVMRWIGEARKSAFQSEASSYLTELQGFEAECYAKNDRDIEQNDFVGGGGGTASYSLTGYTANTTNFEVKDAATDISGSLNTEKIEVSVDDGAVTGFIYCDGTYYVKWIQGTGWDDVTDATP